MKKVWKTVKWISLSVLGIALVGFLFMYFVFFARPSEISKFTEIKDTKWHTVSLKGKTKSSDGSEYAIFVRKGTSQNVMIHFSGGGACWDSTTASKPISVLSAFDATSGPLQSFYFPKLQFFYPKALGGIADNEDPQNAFRDWTIIFIPYTTGDLHIGNSSKTYIFNGKTFDMHYNGRNNTLAALDWVFENVKVANKILVSGESAGAWASAFWVPYVADNYPNNKIYALSDCAGIKSDRWKNILDRTWQAESSKILGFQITDNIFEDAFIHRTDSTKRNIKYLHSNTLYDDVLTRFDAALNHKPTHSNKFIDDWSANTKASMTRLSKANIDYNYFITDWGFDPKRKATQHTLTTNEFYHTSTADGISYAQWLKRNIIDDEDVSLGKRLLEK